MVKKTRVIEASYPIDNLSSQKFSVVLVQDKDTGQLRYVIRFIETMPTMTPQTSYKDMKETFKRLFESPSKVIVHTEELTEKTTDSDMDVLNHITEQYYDSEGDL